MEKHWWMSHNNSIGLIYPHARGTPWWPVEILGAEFSDERSPVLASRGKVQAQKLAAAAAAAAKSLQSCLTLCDPIDGSPLGSPIPGILQATTMEWVAISFSNAWKWNMKVKLLSRVWLSEPMDCRLSGSSIHGIFQARVLEWGAIAFSEQGNYILLN